MTTRIPRNARQVFYANESVFRGGKRFAGREQQSTTFREARKFLDDLDAPGNVEVWTALGDQRRAYASRHADGSWTAINWITGKWDPIS